MTSIEQTLVELREWASQHSNVTPLDGTDRDSPTFGDLRDVLRRITLLEAALREADKRLCELSPYFPPDLGPDLCDAEEIEKTGAVVMQIRTALANLHQQSETK